MSSSYTQKPNANLGILLSPLHQLRSQYQTQLPPCLLDSVSHTDSYYIFSSTWENLTKVLLIHSKNVLKRLCCFHRQEDLWSKNPLKALPALLNSSNMLACREGLVPACVHPLSQVRRLMRKCLQMLVGPSLIFLMEPMTKSNLHPSLVPALPSIIGNIVTGDDAQTQASVCEAWFDLPSRQSPDQIKIITVGLEGLKEEAETFTTWCHCTVPFACVGSRAGKRGKQLLELDKRRITRSRTTKLTTISLEDSRNV
ncbi:hypothetical protein Bca4012_079726 [Brassica carinata]